MIIYIIKMVFCSAVLLIGYFLLLEKEKMHRFNRFYLLLSITASFIIPVITIESISPILPVVERNYPGYENVSPIVTIQGAISTEGTNFFSLTVLFIYTIVTAILFLRFLKNLNSLFISISSNTIVPYNGAKLVLVKNNVTPHSFWNYIFINRKDFANGAIEKEILHHELTHVQQKHSIDVLFIELLQVFFWFNPFFIFYRKLIQLNHEFLADDVALYTCGDVASYQCLLIGKASQKKSLHITCQFNYLITKKRLIMMTKSTSRKAALCRQLAVIPLVIFTAFLFSTKSIAQDKNPTTKPERRVMESTKEGVSKEVQDEYDAILNKYRSKNTKGSRYSWIPYPDRDRLEAIYKSMSKEQQKEKELKSGIFFLPPPAPFQKAVPTAGQLNSWKNGKLYGVWIDGKKISNAELNKYEPSNFSHFFVSKLYGAAKTSVKYYYQVDLMTNDYYQEDYKRTMENKRSTMLSRYEPQNSRKK